MFGLLPATREASVETPTNRLFGSDLVHDVSSNASIRLFENNEGKPGDGSQTSFENIMSPDTTCSRQEETLMATGGVGGAISTNEGEARWREDVAKKKSRKVQYTHSMLAALEEAFQCCQYPNREDREELEVKIQLSADKIKNWFQNRRCKARKQQRIASGGVTPVAHPPLSSVPVASYGGATVGSQVRPSSSTVHWPDLATSDRQSYPPRGGVAEGEWPGRGDPPQASAPPDTYRPVTSAVEDGHAYQRQLSCLYDSVLLATAGSTHQNYWPYLYTMPACPYGFHPCGCKPVGAGWEPGEGGYLGYLGGGAYPRGGDPAPEAVPYAPISVNGGGGDAQRDGKSPTATWERGYTPQSSSPAGQYGCGWSYPASRPPPPHPAGQQRGALSAGLTLPVDLRGRPPSTPSTTAATPKGATDDPADEKRSVGRGRPDVSTCLSPAAAAKTIGALTDLSSALGRRHETAACLSFPGLDLLLANTH